MKIDKVESLDSPISGAYEKFFDKFKEIDQLTISEYKPVHILAYLCKRYRSYYGLEYTFKFNSVPSKCYEIFQIKKISQMISSDPQALVNYIDWVFDKKVILRKKKITSLGYFSNLDIVNEFKFSFLFENKKLERSSVIASNYLEIIRAYDLEISTYGELAFVKNMRDESGECKYKDLFEKISSLGFDVSILDKIA